MLDSFAIALVEMGCPNRCHVYGKFADGSIGIAHHWLTDEQVRGDPLLIYPGVFERITRAEVLERYSSRAELAAQGRAA